MSKELYKKALIELGKRVDLAENPNYIIKLALEKAIANETIDNNYIKHLGNLWGQTKMVDIGSYAVLKQALNELEGLKKFKETFDKYELAKKRDFIAYENWLESEKELNELTRNVARYFELDFNLTRDGVFHYSFLQTSKLENETIQECETRLDDEFNELKEKLSKVGKEMSKEKTHE